MALRAVVGGTGRVREGVRGGAGGGSPPVSTPWAPTNYATQPQVWFDAQTAASITQSGGLVSQWADRSANTLNASQATGGSQPSYNATGLNGFPAITYTSGKSLATPNAALAGPFTMFAVLSKAITGDATNNGIITSSDSFGLGLEVYESSGSYFPSVSGGQFTSLYGTGTNPKILAAILNGASSAVRADGSQVMTGNLGDATQTSSDHWILGNGVYTHPLIGALGEILVIPGALSDADLQLFEGYLAWRWGFQSLLPVGHPYKNAAPTV